jgi:hypothetical protein
MCWFIRQIHKLRAFDAIFSWLIRQIHKLRALHAIVMCCSLYLRFLWELGVANLCMYDQLADLEDLDIVNEAAIIDGQALKFQSS